MKFEIITIGANKRGPLCALQDEYCQRLSWALTLTELESGKKDEAARAVEEHRLIESRLKPGTKIIMLDERGKTLRSIAFANLLQDWANQGYAQVQVVIGGATGLSDSLRARADLVLSFGAQTWPHMLARVLLLEQIYRAQTILSGHPYHRE